MLLHCPQSKNRGAKNSNVSNISGRSRRRLKDSLHAADLVPRVKVFEVEEVQQHLRHVFVLIDDVLVNRETYDVGKRCQRNG